jgi:type 1 glutamine amidotransferase
MYVLTPRASWRLAPLLLACGAGLSIAGCSGPADGGNESPDSPSAYTGPGASGANDNTPGASAAPGNGDTTATPSGSTMPPSGNTTPATGAGSEMTPGLPLEPGDTSGGADPAEPEGTGTVATPPTLTRVLVFTRTAGYRHDSIGAGVEAIRQLGNNNGFAVEATEDPAQFNDAGLASFDVVVWLSTTADVLNDEQQGAFERYIQAGGGWVGVHAAADTEYTWPWYGQLLGGNAWFLIHPAIQTVQLDVEEPDHASTAHLPARFSLQDEWYNYMVNPRPAVNVLLRLDESSYQVGEGAMGSDHPIAWYHEFDGGRAWYTGLGHRIELYTDPVFTQHLLGGIRWAAGVAP